MNCKSVKENLVFFLENELPEERRIQMENHLKNCPDCSRLLEEFSLLWEGVQQREKIQPSPYFWTKLKQRIVEYEEGEKPVFGWIEGLIRLTRPAVVVAAMLICIFLGYSLGNFPQQVNGQTVSQVDERTVMVQEFFNSDYLNPLSDPPSGSIEATYLEMISEE
jgi:predicted anti-sigma-YlaC factor YlaD